MASTIRVYYRLELFKILVIPFTPIKARNKIPNKSSDRSISVFYYADRLVNVK